MSGELWLMMLACHSILVSAFEFLSSSKANMHKWEVDYSSVQNGE